ncbi:methyl-accepting chemotaxis protein [Chitinibacter sp. S2-10]|uniref:methyl-accepting chemotaxis protein n=1 Tax=Chitinibacter sp. S2-10 TaxID=3373597 RepID=UPI003977A568
MKIAQKLLLMISVIVTIALVSAGINYVFMGNVKQASYQITDNILPSIITLNTAQKDFLKMRVVLRTHIGETDEDKMKALVKTYWDLSKEVDQQLADYEKWVLDDTDKQNLAAINQAMKAAHIEYDKTLEQSIQNDKALASYTIQDKATPKGNAVDEAFETAITYNVKLSNSLTTDVNQAIAFSLNLAVILGLVSIITILALGLPLRQGINRSLNEMRQFLLDLSHNYDFTRRVKISNSRDEIGESLTALNGLLDTMQSSLRQLHHVGQNLSVSVSTLSSASTQLSSSSSGVSDSASSMAAGVEEVTTSISHVADRAHVCDQTAREAGRQASTGGKVIDETINSINQIANQVRTAAEQIETLKERSINISSVINVIKAIADQTNLLALNAAIEAARAGEMGRGFAIVADEVRKLAEQTGSSTQEIANMVAAIQHEATQTVNAMQETVRHVDEGVRHAQQASSAIASIRRSTDEVVDQVSEISSSMREQSSASNVMAQQVERVAQMSEETSTVAQQTASEGERLRQLGQELEQSVSRYRV